MVIAHIIPCALEALVLSSALAVLADPWLAVVWIRKVLGLE